MSPLGYLLMSLADSKLRIDRAQLQAKVEAIGVSLEDAIVAATAMGFRVVKWVN